MHGWLALPLAFQGLIVLAAPALAIVGAWRDRAARSPVSKMALYAACYSMAAVFIAFGYLSTKYPGTYDAGPWFFLAVLLFPFAFAVISGVWIIARALLANRPER